MLLGCGFICLLARSTASYSHLVGAQLLALKLVRFHELFSFFIHLSLSRLAIFGCLLTRSSCLSYNFNPFAAVNPSLLVSVHVGSACVFLVIDKFVDRNVDHLVVVVFVTCSVEVVTPKEHARLCLIVKVSFFRDVGRDLRRLNFFAERSLAKFLRQAWVPLLWST